MARKPLHYSEYLQLDRILKSQELVSENLGKRAHDEMLFIVTHQAYELWFKQILYELKSVLQVFQSRHVDEKNMGIVASRVNRINEILKVLISQLRIIETMTPLDFLEFRDHLVPASGFQSVQFRLLEIMLGVLKARKSATFSPSLSKLNQALVTKTLKEPSLFDCTETWLERIPFLDVGGFHFLEAYHKAVKEMLAKNEAMILKNPNLTEMDRNHELSLFEDTKAHFEALFDPAKHDEMLKLGERRLSYKATLAALFIHLYRDEPILHLPFRFLTGLTELDELFASWRYNHLLMVHRMIGRKTGTGGTSGYSYLKSTTEGAKVFSDLANLSTFMIPRSEIPELPPQIEKTLGFAWT